MQRPSKKRDLPSSNKRGYRNTAVRLHTHGLILDLAKRHRLDNIEVMDVAIAYFEALPANQQASLIRGEKVGR